MVIRPAPRWRIAALLVLAACLLVAGSACTAEEATAPAPSEADELARRATDPTASPMNFAFINSFTTSFFDRADGSSVDETGYLLKFQPVLPFKAWGVAHILRMTLPYQVTGPGPGGLDDITIFDLLIFPQSWGRLGVGAVGSFSARTDDVDSHAAGGPAIGFVARVTDTLNMGLFNQNLFGNDVAISQFQPIVAYMLGRGWSLSLGDLQWPYDWDRHEFVSMPIGVQLGKVVPIAGQPMRFAVNPQYDLKDQPGGPRASIQVTHGPAPGPGEEVNDTRSKPMTIDEGEPRRGPAASRILLAGQSLALATVRLGAAEVATRQRSGRRRTRAKRAGTR